MATLQAQNTAPGTLHDAAQATDNEGSGKHYGKRSDHAFAQPSAGSSVMHGVHELSLTSGSHANTSNSNSHQRVSASESNVPAFTKPLHLEPNDDNYKEARKHTDSEPYANPDLPYHLPSPLDPSQQPQVTDTFDLTRTVPVRHLLSPPGPNASAEDRVDFLQQQLDSLEEGQPVIEDLLSLGGSSSERRQGGVALLRNCVLVDGSPLCFPSRS